MTEGDKAPNTGGQWGRAVDVLIIGGGVMGLWAALKAGRAGLDVLLVDEGRLGQGASHGHLGALMAHMPDKWNEKKQFQFDALLSLEAEVGALEAATGLSTGYARAGRLIPLPKPHLRDIALRHEVDARANWRASDGRTFEWRVTDAPSAPGWPLAEGIEGGFVLDTFAARANPRAFTAVLIDALRRLPNVTVVEGMAVIDLDAAAARATLSSGETVAFGHAIIAAGYKAFPMLERLLPPREKPLGVPVKGQSALLAAEIDPSLPLIFLDGLYVVPHEGGRVAIGSTSENAFDEPFTTDHQLDDLIARARGLVPALESAAVIDRWAGLRPKAAARDPLVGPLPGAERIIALTGGFKVSFGIAHRLADAALQAVLGTAEVAIPRTFRVPHHLA
ncbi:NAD(P)/FAD-dependent oxidoreductase [Rhizobium sp. C4]|uniref:NAD(P)/FAD-dependent oxidoreductase n=1 Tax=Rhizobium sp. C4 TaxID=1349800 RepID=UPI001E482A56|nr:FAD-binding oxidoreductase [Rhizobium sp. C4]MCD2174183.1 FAD-binding oxidoreductase [Rhizobium sp. C4]